MRIAYSPLSFVGVKNIIASLRERARLPSARTATIAPSSISAAERLFSEVAKATQIGENSWLAFGVPTFPRSWVKSSMSIFLFGLLKICSWIFFEEIMTQMCSSVGSMEHLTTYGVTSEVGIADFNSTKSCRSLSCVRLSPALSCVRLSPAVRHLKLSQEN